MVEAGSCEPDLGEQSAGHCRGHFQSEELASVVGCNTVPGVQIDPEKALAHAELLPLVGSGVAGEVTALQESPAVGSWEHSELLGQAPYARWATFPKRPLGCKESVPVVAGILGEGDSEKAAEAGGHGAGCA